MTTDIRWSLVLVSSLVLWLPALRGTLSGEMELVDGAVRYVLALGVTWFGIGIVDQIIRRYAETSAAEDRAERRRRRSDQMVAVADEPQADENGSDDGGTGDVDLGEVRGGAVQGDGVRGDEGVADRQDEGLVLQRS